MHSGLCSLDACLGLLSFKIPFLSPIFGLEHYAGSNGVLSGDLGLRKESGPGVFGSSASASSILCSDE